MDVLERIMRAADAYATACVNNDGAAQARVDLWNALETMPEPSPPRGAVENEEALLRIVLRALSDARTQANPHDPAVRAYWRDEIRAALATPSRGAVR